MEKLKAGIEHLDKNTNKEICADILRGIIRYVPINESKDKEKYLEELKRKLKFNHLEDCDLAIASIDLVEDTEYAIIEFLTNGLGKVNEYYRVDIGEAYLRLYGTLNAIYQQSIAIRELTTIFNLPNISERISKITNHKVIEIRNKVGSHTINYLLDKTKKASRENLDFFRVTQSTLSKFGTNILVVSNRGETEEINLRDLINSFNQEADLILLDLCQKAIFSIFPNKYEHRDWLEVRLNLIKNRIKEKSLLSTNASLPTAH